MKVRLDPMSRPELRQTGAVQSVLFLDVTFVML
jgi:hypothetical protein